MDVTDFIVEVIFIVEVVFILKLSKEWSITVL